MWKCTKCGRTFTDSVGYCRRCSGNVSRSKSGEAEQVVINNQFQGLGEPLCSLLIFGLGGIGVFSVYGVLRSELHLIERIGLAVFFVALAVVCLLLGAVVLYFGIRQYTLRLEIGKQINVRWLNGFFSYGYDQVRNVNIKSEESELNALFVAKETKLEIEFEDGKTASVVLKGSSIGLVRSALKRHLISVDSASDEMRPSVQRHSTKSMVERDDVCAEETWSFAKDSEPEVVAYVETSDSSEARGRARRIGICVLLLACALVAIARFQNNNDTSSERARRAKQERLQQDLEAGVEQLFEDENVRRMINGLQDELSLTDEEFDNRLKSVWEKLNPEKDYSPWQFHLGAESDPYQWRRFVKIDDSWNYQAVRVELMNRGDVPSTVGMPDEADAGS